MFSCNDRERPRDLPRTNTQIPIINLMRNFGLDAKNETT